MTFFYTLTGENKILESCLPNQRDRMDMIAPPPFIFPNTANLSAGQNGRVNLSSTSSAGGFLDNPAMGGFTHRTKVDANPAQDLMRGNWTENKLSQTFFGPDNTKVIQRGIKKEVYDRSGDKRWVIDDQSADELQIIMRSIFLQYAKNLDKDIPGQVKDLNDLVLEWCVPRILSEIGMYKYYLDDISKMPVPISHPVSQSSAGTKSLPFRKFM